LTSGSAGSPGGRSPCTTRSMPSSPAKASKYGLGGPRAAADRHAEMAGGLGRVDLGHDEPGLGEERRERAVEGPEPEPIQRWLEQFPPAADGRAAHLCAAEGEEEAFRGLPH